MKEEIKIDDIINAVNYLKQDYKNSTYNFKPYEDDMMIIEFNYLGFPETIKFKPEVIKQLNEIVRFNNPIFLKEPDTIIIEEFLGVKVVISKNEIN